MRVIIAFFFVLLTFCAHAQKTDCETIVNAPDTCKNTAGCHYESSICRNCDPGSYCSGTNNQEISCSIGTQGLYPHSAEGAEGSNECYRPVTCSNQASGTAQCKYYGDLQAGGQGVCCPGSNCTGYHVENLAEFEHGDDDALECYANTRNCDLFSYSTPGVQLAENGHPEIAGAATWTGNYWNIENCVYNPTGDSHQPLSHLFMAKHCYTKNLSWKSYLPSIASAQTEIEYDITYSNPTLGGYYCDACEAGYIVDPDSSEKTNPDVQFHFYYAYQDPYNGGITIEYDYWKYDDCKQDDHETYVCKCSQIPQGYYTEGDDCNWEYAQFHHQLSLADVHEFCHYYSCPAGKTTDGPGANGYSACKYRTNTKFCDASGCFSLSDINSWTPAQ